MSFLSALFISTPVSAQKFGHFDLDSLLSIMPEMAKANNDAAAFYKMLETDLMKMQTDVDAKIRDYEASQSTWSPLIRQHKEAEITSLNQRIQGFQMTAQSDFENRKAELVRPIMAKVNNVVGEIVRERGLKYVFDNSKGSGNLIFADPADDIFNLVKVKLGIPN